MKHLLIVLMSIMFALRSYAGTPDVAAIYDMSVTIPESVRTLPDPTLREMAVRQLKARDSRCLMVKSGDLYAFIPNGTLSKKIDVVGDGSVFIDLKGGVVSSQRAILEKKYVVATPYVMESWKVLPDEKVVNGRRCRKAVSSSDAGLVAWFCEEIPCAMGPAGYGGLPGLIMLLETPYATYTLSSFEAGKPVSMAGIVNGQKGEKVTMEQYQRIRAEKIGALGGNASGEGVQVIRM